VKSSRGAPKHNKQQDRVQAYYEVQDHGNPATMAEEYTQQGSTHRYMLSCACQTGHKHIMSSSRIGVGALLQRAAVRSSNN